MAESCRSLDVSRLHRSGNLAPGWWGSLQWTHEGRQAASVTLRAEADWVVLTYRWRAAGQEWQDVEEPVQIVRVPCHFGGSRPYFICPGVVNGVACRRRVAKLYGPGRYFLCRHCYRLAHASQNEAEWERALRRTDKIRIRLGGRPGMALPFPKRPKGMWRRTYDRLRHKAFEAELEADLAIGARAERLIERLDGGKPKKRSGR